MKTKFIEDTNEQYSIREDGAVISHYRLRYSPLQGKYFMIFENKELKLSKKDKNVNINTKNGKKTVSPKKLLFEYFKYSICKKCNSKVEQDLLKSVCKNCIRLNKNKYNRERAALNPEKIKEQRKRWKDNNIEAYRSMSKKASKKAMINVTRNYIAQTLNIFVKDLSDDLYSHHRKLILLKRQIAEDQKINIEKLV
jgi:hypothetical protein